jgi:CubicO group peptidase (beta-lactamase class C family)
MKSKLILFLTAIIIVSSCKKDNRLLIPASGFNNPLITSTDSAVQSLWLQYGPALNTAGVSIGIYKNNTATYYGYGETKLGNKKAPDKKTFFEIGSVTKTFTSIAITNMLLEKGQSIETPVRTYLPANLPTLARDGAEVNFKHLLTHTSGLGYFPDNFGAGYYFGKLAEEFEKYDRNKLFTWLLNTPLRHKPFTTWEYSNGGMGLLGTILELNYNQNYGAVLKEKLFVPLQLTDTKTDMAEADMNRWATGYNGTKEAPYWKSLNAMNGAGVIKSTASDMIQYGIANLNPPNNLLGTAITQTHLVTFLPFSEGASNKINGRLGWFQFIHNQLPNESFIWHNGGTGGFSSDLFINKRNNSILVLLYNSANASNARDDLRLELLKLISE